MQSLYRSFSDFAELLQLRKSDDPKPYTPIQLEMEAKAVLSWFKQVQDKWLLILDNADDMDLDPPGLMNFVPNSKHGHVIITSRDPMSRGIGLSGLKVDSMESSEAVDLLLKRSGRGNTSQNAAQAEKLVQYLGYLPLAIDQAGAFILARNLEVQDLVTQFDHVEQNVLEYKMPSALQQYESSVLTTWEISLDYVMKKSKEATELLQILGVSKHLSSMNLI